MKSSILVTHNRKLKLKLAAVETARRVTDTELKVAREQIAQLQGQIKVAADIGADRNKYKTAWDAVCFAITNVDHFWWFDCSDARPARTMQELAVETINDLRTSDAVNAEKVKVLTDKIRDLDGIISLKTAAACENEKQCNALERENFRLREENASLQTTTTNAVNRDRRSQDTIDSQTRIFSELHEILRRAGIENQTCCIGIVERLQTFVKFFESLKTTAAANEMHAASADKRYQELNYEIQRRTLSVKDRAFLRW